MAFRDDDETRDSLLGAGTGRVDFSHDDDELAAPINLQVALSKIDLYATPAATITADPVREVDVLLQQLGRSQLTTDIKGRLEFTKELLRLAEECSDEELESYAVNPETGLVDQVQKQQIRLKLEFLKQMLKSDITAHTSICSIDGLMYRPRQTAIIISLLLGAGVLGFNVFSELDISDVSIDSEASSLTMQLAPFIPSLLMTLFREYGRLPILQLQEAVAGIRGEGSPNAGRLNWEAVGETLGALGSLGVVLACYFFRNDSLSTTIPGVLATGLGSALLPVAAGTAFSRCSLRGGIAREMPEASVAPETPPDIETGRERIPRTLSIGSNVGAEGELVRHPTPQVPFYGATTSEAPAAAPPADRPRTASMSSLDIDRDRAREGKAREQEQVNGHRCIVM